MFKVFKTSGIEGNYSVSSNALFVNNGCWSVYPAKHKTTKKAYSVWQFNKKDWETQLANAGLINKSNKSMIMNDILENIKLFIGNQSKFKHPNFLTIIEPLEDHKNRVLFVTEYVMNDLYSINKKDLDEIMITKGLLQICNGLKFLHESVNSVDLNLNPSSILITDNYDWKINNLTFLENISNGIISDKIIDPLNSRMPSFLSIDFRFTSPNLLLNHKIDYINDIFSVCCLIYFLFNDGKILIDCPSSSSISEYERQVNKLNQLLKNAQNNQNIKHNTFENIPDNFYNTFLNSFIESQESNTDVIQLKKVITINDIISSQIFNNELIKLLNSLDEYNTFSNYEKINFLKNLKIEIFKFPKPLLINKFIPILINSIDISQFKKNNKPTSDDEELIVESCENLLLLSKNLSQLTFTDKVFPLILTILKKIPFDSFKILLLKNIELINKCSNTSNSNSNNEIFTKFSLDLFEKCINEKNSMIVQELTLTNIKIILQCQQYNTITTNILPKLSTLYSTTTSLKIKTLTVNTFIIMVSELDTKILDDHSIVENLLPLINNTSSTVYSNTKFTNNLVKLYNCIFDKLSKSTNKSFNIKGNELNIYDIILELGFTIWKIGKFITNQQDLNNIFNTWNRIEIYLKDTLNSQVKMDNSVESMSRDESSTSTNTIPVIKSVQPIRPESQPIKTYNSTSTIMQPMKSINQTISTPTYSPNTIQVMKPMNKPITTTTTTTQSSLSFGQIQPQVQSQVKTTSTPVSNTIDWSQADKFKVMQPVNKTPINNFSVMQPMKATSRTATASNGNNDDDDDDEWSDFAVGSTTTKNVAITNNDVWGDSLI